MKSDADDSPTLPVVSLEALETGDFNKNLPHSVPQENLEVKILSDPVLL